MKRSSKTDEIISLADMVIVGNKYLAEHARQFNSNVEIVPTTIDTDYHKPSVTHSSSPICIGWTGSETTIRHFKLIIPVLKRIKAVYGDKVSFLQISNVTYECPEIGLETVVWNAQDEIQQLERIDIGIMPLPNDEWSKGKCGFKGLQYMALEIPTVMSPVGVNTEIINNGENGFFADSEEQWFEVLCKLIDDNQLRKTIGAKGRETIIERYSILSQETHYLSIFEQLTNNR